MSAGLFESELPDLPCQLATYHQQELADLAPLPEYTGRREDPQIRNAQGRTAYLRWCQAALGS